MMSLASGISSGFKVLTTHLESTSTSICTMAMSKLLFSILAKVSGKYLIRGDCFSFTCLFNQLTKGRSSISVGKGCYWKSLSG